MINPNTKRNLLKIAVFGALIYGAYKVVNGISKKQKLETIIEEVIKPVKQITKKTEKTIKKVVGKVVSSKPIKKTSKKKKAVKKKTTKKNDDIKVYVGKNIPKGIAFLQKNKIKSSVDKSEIGYVIVSQKDAAKAIELAKKIKK